MPTTKKAQNPKPSSRQLGKKREKTPSMIKNPGGRPSVFDDAAPKVIQFIRNGNTYECASACARITYHTFNDWMKLGEKDINEGKHTKFSKFFHDIKQAEMDCENEIVQAWKNQIPQNWQAGKEFLARRNPEKWAAKDRVDVTSKGEKIEGQPVFLPMKKSDEQET